MITKLYLKNFKSFGEEMQKLPLRRLTLIFGANSSGKSSILQSILFFKQTLEKSSQKTLLVSRGELIDVGNFRDFIHQHDSSRTLTIGFDYTNWMMDFFDNNTIIPNSTLMFDYNNEYSYNQLSSYKGTTDMFKSYFKEIFSIPDFQAKFNGKFVVDELVEYTDKSYQYYNESIEKLIDYLFEITKIKALILEKLENWDKSIDDIVSYLEWQFLDSIRNQELVEIIDSGNSGNKIMMASETEMSLEEMFKKSMLNAFRARTSDDSLPFYYLSDIFSEVVKDDHFILEDLVKAIKRFKFDYDNKFSAENIKSTSLDLLKDKHGILRNDSNPLTYNGDGWELEADAYQNWPKYSDNVDLIFPQLFLNIFNVVFSAYNFDSVRMEPGDPYSFIGDRQVSMKELLFSPVKLFQAIRDFLNENLAKTYFIGPLRNKPEKFNYFSGNIIEYVGSSGKQTADALYSHLGLIEKLNTKLDKIEFGYRLKLNKNEEDEVFSLLLEDTVLQTDVRLPEVGVGISQVLPIMVQSYISEEQTICIEQPELHLHPKMQSNLAQFFAERINETKNVQFIIETHSEHLILRIQKLIRQKLFSAKDVSVIYINKEPQGSVAYLLELDEEGDFLTEWPGGFFEEAFNEVFD